MPDIVYNQLVIFRMKRSLTDELITTILANIPNGENPTTYIADILNIEREYVYRRLRGETNFTIDEIALLALKLGFSVDNIVGLKKQDTALFDLDFLIINELEDVYLRKIEKNIEIVRNVNNSKSSNIRWAGNTIPFAIFNYHPALTRFDFYKWVYQTANTKQYYYFSDFQFSNELTTKLGAYTFNAKAPSHTTFILDNNFALSTIRSIEYFQVRGLISNSEIQELKKELLEIIGNLEFGATNGVLKSAGKIDIYISSVNLNSTYTHIEYDDHCLSQFIVYTVNILNSNNKTICDIQKGWIESMKKYSTHITQCNEIERFRYFDKQREIINKLGQEAEEL